MNKRSFLNWLISVLSAGCTRAESPLSEPKEPVLVRGQSISFENANGSGSIEYVSPLERRFRFKYENGQVDKTIKLIARKERFLGEFGLYEPAERWFFSSDKTVRIVASEAQMHFKSEEEAKEFMIQGSAIQKWVYNCDGYVVGFSASPQRNQISITLYRYYINDTPAMHMPGCDDQKVRVSESEETRDAGGI